MRPNNQAKLHFECLEDRDVPALLLQLDTAGNLTGIFGTPAGDVLLDVVSANEVRVVENGNDLGTYSVPGNLAACLGNSAVTLRVTVAFNGNDLGGNLDLKVGNALPGYTVNVLGGGGTLAGNLTVATGNGSESITFSDLTVQGSVGLDTHGGVDVASLSVMTIDGDLRTANVNDLVLTSTNVAGHWSHAGREGLAAFINLFDDSSVAGHVVINLGAGNDDVELWGTMGGNVVVNLGNGANDFNSFLVPATILGNLTILGGNQDDTAFITGDIGGNFTFVGNGGADDVTFGGESIATILGNLINLNMGNGNDTVTSFGLIAPGARFMALMGNGNDLVDWGFDIPQVASAYLDGGTGRNVADLTGGTIAFPIIIRNFIGSTPQGPGPGPRGP